jgi:Papain family cysteine protease
MAITFEAVRDALAGAAARWYTDPRARGGVPQHALGLANPPAAKSTIPVSFDDSRAREAISRAVAARRHRLGGVQVSDAGATLPRQVDWRNHLGVNAVTAVRDQQNCGSCVGFAAIALMESMLSIERGMTSDLCEAEFFFCNALASCGMAGSTTRRSTGANTRARWQSTSAPTRVCQCPVPTSQIAITFA